MHQAPLPWPLERRAFRLDSLLSMRKNQTSESSRSSNFAADDRARFADLACPKQHHTTQRLRTYSPSSTHHPSLAAQPPPLQTDPPLPSPPAPPSAQLQQTVSRLTDECWDKCISSPGSYLSSREQACLSNCARRFLDTTQFVVKYFASKGGGGGGGDF